MRRKPSINKKGVTLSLITLIEVVLVLLVILIITASVMGIVNKTTFFSSFFAKDNAHLVEALHAVPNGEVHFGYLWNNDQYLVGFYEDHVEVATAASTKEGVLEGVNIKKKYFGVSEQTPVRILKLFTPKFYQLVYTPGEARNINVERNFKSELTCPASSTPLTGLRVTGSQSDSKLFSESISKDAAAYILRGAQTAAHSRGKTLKEDGMRIHVHVSESLTNEISVYYTFDSATVRLSCLVAKELSTETMQGAQTQNVRYASIDQLPSGIDAGDAAIVIHMQVTDPAQVDAAINKVQAGIFEYWGDAK